MKKETWFECKNIKEFQTPKRRRGKKKAEINWDYGIKYILYSHNSKRHWIKIFSEITDIEKLYEYIAKGNIFFEKKQHDLNKLKWKQ